MSYYFDKWFAPSRPSLVSSKNAPTSHLFLMYFGQMGREPLNLWRNIAIAKPQSSKKKVTSAAAGAKSPPGRK
jgi:hypothetical protein